MTEEQTPRRQDAKTPRLDRRAFMTLGLAGGAATLAAACGWDGGNVLRPRLLDISRLNDWVGEQVLFASTRLARTYSPAARSAMLPSYFISNALPMLENPDAWRLRVAGLVQRPLELSLNELMTMPRVTYTVKHHCVEGWSAIATWHGVPVAAIVARCQPIAARASCISAAVWYLSPRSLAIALRITWASASGTSALNLRGSGAGSSRCFATTAYTDSPSNGTRPATHSNRTTPAAYRSLRASSSIPNSCSGDM